MTAPLLKLLALAGFLLGIHSSLTANELALDLQSLRGQHPRLLLTEGDFAKIRERSWDALGEDYRQFLSQSGIEMLDMPPVPNEFAGRRLLHQSRKAVKRIVTWSLLYRLEGNPEFRDRAILELENVTNFPTWNPAHFLDVGEMSLAVAIGTDWLWDDLNEEQRTAFLKALKEKAILPSLDESHPDNWWLYFYNNWNPVCHSGLLASALLLAESEPELAEAVIRRAIRAFPAARESYQPSGAYPEGPGYWDYGTAFSSIILNLLDRAFGSTFQLDDDAAFLAAATYRALVVTPTGKSYNYADGYESSRFAVATAWFASKYRDPAALHEMKRGLEFQLASEWSPEDGTGGLLPFLALWYPENTVISELSSNSSLPHAWLGSGPNPVALIRENWETKDALFLGFKGNDGSVSHAHLDAGSFIFEDEGVRWAVDLGSQSYNSLESKGLGIWDKRQHSDRWRVFRLGPYSHNLLLIDERMPSADTKADITLLETAGSRIHGIVDLTPVYKDQASSYKRHFHLHDFRVLEIVDKIKGARNHVNRQGEQAATLHWRMLTRAKVSIEGNRAVFDQDGKTLYLNVVQPDHFILRSAPVDPPPYYFDYSNPGISAVDIWTNAQDDGDQTVRILMSTDSDALEAFVSSQ